MNATESAAMRSMAARLALCERESRELKRRVTRQATELRRAVNEARFLHGVLLAQGIQVPSHSTGDGPHSLSGNRAARLTGGRS